MKVSETKDILIPYIYVQSTRLVIVPMAVPGDSRQGTQQHKLVHCQSLESEFFSQSAVF